MYLDYFSLTRHPFRITPDPSLFFPGGAHGRGVVLDALVYGITTGEGILKVVGEVGSGKTMLCRMLEEKLPDNVEIVYLANPNLTAREIVYAIAFELKLEVDSNTDRLLVMHKLQEYLLKRHGEGATVVVFVEEAQSMPLETLEEIRLFSNLETHRHKLMQIVLFGQPELDKKLQTRSIRQLKERITHSFDLEPLGTEAIREYLHFRLQAAGCPWPQLFSPKAEKILAKASGGLTRRVNILADKSLLAAYADPSSRPEARNSSGEVLPMVWPKHVKIAIKDSDYSKPASFWFKFAGLSFAGILVVSILLMFLAGIINDAGDSTNMSVESLVAAPQVSTPREIPVATSGESAQSPAVQGGRIPEQTESAVQVSQVVEQIEPAAEQVEALAELIVETTDETVEPAVETIAAETIAAEIAEQVEQNATERPVSPVSGNSNIALTQGSSFPAELNRNQTVQIPQSDTAVVNSEVGSESQPEPEAVQLARVDESVITEREMLQQQSIERQNTPAATGTSVVNVAGLAALRRQASEDWLKAIKSRTGFSVQLISLPTTNAQGLEEFLQFLELTGSLQNTYICLISATNRRAEQWMVFNSEFSGLTAARNYIESLPAYVKQYQPFVRNLEDIDCRSF